MFGLAGNALYNYVNTLSDPLGLSRTPRSYNTHKNVDINVHIEKDNKIDKTSNNSKKEVKTKITFKKNQFGNYIVNPREINGKKIPSFVFDISLKLVIGIEISTGEITPLSDHQKIICEDIGLNHT